MFSFGDHCDEFTDRFPRIPPLEAEAFVWQAIKDLFNEHPWIFALKTGYVTTEALYATGTVALTQNSTAVTLTGGTWVTSWTTAPSTRRFVGPGRSESYGITISTSTTGVLDTPWMGANTTAGTYTLFRDTYALPSDCDFGKVYFLLDTTQGRVLPMKDYGVFMRRKAAENAFAITGTPEIATLASLTATGVPQVQFGPQAPSTAEIYTLIYFQKPTKPTSRSSAVVPAFPEAYEDLIWRRAVWQAAVHPRYRRAEAPLYQQEYYDRLFEAISRFDGQSEIRRIVQGTVPNLPSDWLDYVGVVPFRTEYI